MIGEVFLHILSFDFSYHENETFFRSLLDPIAMASFNHQMGRIGYCEMRRCALEYLSKQFVAGWSKLTGDLETSLQKKLHWVMEIGLRCPTFESAIGNCELCNLKSRSNHGFFSSPEHI
jgi:hypothetical protein